MTPEFGCILADLSASLYIVQIFADVFECKTETLGCSLVVYGSLRTN